MNTQFITPNLKKYSILKKKKKKHPSDSLIYIVIVDVGMVSFIICVSKTIIKGIIQITTSMLNQQSRSSFYLEHNRTRNEQ